LRLGLIFGCAGHHANQHKLPAYIDAVRSLHYSFNPLFLLAYGQLAAEKANCSTGSEEAPARCA
jgi:hypothetical protein